MEAEDDSVVADDSEEEAKAEAVVTITSPTNNPTINSNLISSSNSSRQRRIKITGNQISFRIRTARSVPMDMLNRLLSYLLHQADITFGLLGACSNQPWMRTFRRKHPYLVLYRFMYYQTSPARSASGEKNAKQIKLGMLLQWRLP